MTGGTTAPASGAVDGVDSPPAGLVSYTVAVIVRGDVRHVFYFRRRFRLTCIQTMLVEIVIVETTNTSVYRARGMTGRTPAPTATAVDDVDNPVAGLVSCVRQHRARYHAYYFRAHFSLMCHVFRGWAHDVFRM